MYLIVFPCLYNKFGPTAVVLKELCVKEAIELNHGSSKAGFMT